MNSRIGNVTWDDYPPFARLGEPWSLPDDRTVEGLLRSYKAMIAGESDHGLDEYEREWLLNQIESERDLKRIFAGLPGDDLVVPRVHAFMQARHRTPAKRLDPDEAVHLAAQHMARFGAVRDRIVADPDTFWPSARRPGRREEMTDMVRSYSDRLLGLKVRWVDDNTATPGAVKFDGEYLEASIGKSKVTEGLAFSDGELRMSGLAIRAAGAMFDRGELLLRDDLVENTRPPEAWQSVVPLISRLTDWGYRSVVDYLVAPISVERSDGEPFYRLWEGGASMWIGTDAIEVRTDWARRWPNSRYRD